MNCIAPECDKPIFVTSRQLCKTHYHRLMRRNNLGVSRAVPSLTRICLVKNCQRSSKAKGLCGTHYAYMHRYGSATPQLKPRGGQRKPLKTSTDGYVYMTHPVTKRVTLQHRVIMAQKIGRELLPHESVHHKNGIRNDNRIENLELWSSFQPSGQRVEDKVKYAREILALYGDL